jgi:hypothetical protein
MRANVGDKTVDECKEALAGITVIGFTPLIDLESDDLDKAVIKADAPAVKAKKERIKKTVEAMPRDDGGWSSKPILYK